MELAKFLEKIKTDRATWELQLARVAPEQMSANLKKTGLIDREFNQRLEVCLRYFGSCTAQNIEDTL